MGGGEVATHLSWGCYINPEGRMVIKTKGTHHQADRVFGLLKEPQELPSTAVDESGARFPQFNIPPLQK